MDCQQACSMPSGLDPLLQGMINLAMTIPGALLCFGIFYLATALFGAGRTPARDRPDRL